ncbi:MAG: hypothetical protein JGK08_25060, partial [Microcoleus sp. PH2017_04_SCI_O_A]|nr:hypothetical protein [Microcoleus sp. PH2017_04_SCI_O_A]
MFYSYNLAINCLLSTVNYQLPALSVAEWSTVNCQLSTVNCLSILRSPVG